jgi:nicotinate-nucleotide--dimethylbenzimidazole phosphoribosyltransferase
MSQVLQHVVGAIGEASEAAATAARAKLRGAGMPMLERLAGYLAGAQHSALPRVARRLVVVVAGDHGAGDPGIALGANHPTVVAAHAIADGTAAVVQIARPTSIVLVDAGAAEPTHMPGIAIAIGTGPSRNVLHEPPLTPVDAVLGLEAGIALSLSLSEPTPERTGLDVLAIGALGIGSEVAAAALLGAVIGRTVPLGEEDAPAELAMTRAISLRGASGMDLLVHAGGPETAVLAGLILGAASMNVPVLLDSYATGAAALVAAKFAPAVRGYLIAAHRGTQTMPAMLEELGLDPIFDVGLGHGEGTGAAMLLPMLDQVAALAARS